MLKLPLQEYTLRQSETTQKIQVPHIHSYTQQGGRFLVAFKDNPISVEVTAPTTDEAIDTDLLEENLQRASSYEDNQRFDILFYAINVLPPMTRQFGERMVPCQEVQVRDNTNKQGILVLFDSCVSKISKGNYLISSLAAYL